MKPSRRSEVAPFRVMDVMRAAERREAGGAEVLHLEVGQPSTPAPATVIAAAHRALDEQVLGYTTALGTEPLRRAIAGHIGDWYGHQVDEGAIAVTTGASGGCALAFLAAFDPGDRVALLAPGYPAYRNMLHAFSVEVVDVPVGPDTDHRITPAILDAHLPLDGLVLASPSNPTGTMLDADALAELCAWCDAHDVRLVSDEIYHGITFETAADTATKHSSTAIVVNSFSKYFSMTGWRLGWLVLPDDLRRPVERLAQNLFIAAPSPSQVAAVAAFDAHEELGGHVARYRTNRDVLVAGLVAAGFDDIAPAEGAFYLWVGTGHLGVDASTVCARWLDELGVAATPGTDFDPFDGEAAVRLSFAGSTDTMHRAVERIADWRP